MSTATKSWTPTWRAASAAPITPPVGPDARSDTARFDTYSGGMTPPVDCMMSSGPAYPAARSFAWRLST